MKIQNLQVEYFTIITVSEGLVILGCRILDIGGPGVEEGGGRG